VAHPELALSSEARLLFRLAAPVPEAAARAALLHDPVDWERLTVLAQREKAVGVVAEQLGGRDGEPPPAGSAAIRRVAVLTTFHMLHLEKRLKQTVAALAGAGIDVVLLKGAGLAFTAYPAFADRVMADLDLLVRASEARRAQTLLASAGWVPGADAERDGFYSGHHHLPPMHDASAPSAALEVHTELFIAGHPLGLTADAVWAAARPVRVGGTAAFVPHPHHQLLHGCLHFAWGHGMQAGAWRTFRDVGAIVRTGEVEWDGFVRLAEETRGQSCCYWTFELGRVLAGVEVPASVLARLRPPHGRLVHDRIRRHLAMTLLPTESASPSVRLNRWMWEAAILPGRYGHGTIRPWAQEDRMVSGQRAAGGGGEGARGSRWWAGLHKAGAYRRYLRTMLTG
jgi:hypothetical protein